MPLAGGGGRKRFSFQVFRFTVWQDPRGLRKGKQKFEEVRRREAQGIAGRLSTLRLQTGPAGGAACATLVGAERETENVKREMVPLSGTGAAQVEEPGFSPAAER
jgi:hypothetical protein